MKTFRLLLILLFTISTFSFGQEAPVEEFKPSGKPFIKVFWNYHADFTEGTEQINSFEIQRAYIGYKYKFSENISAKLTIDGRGKSSGASEYTAFLKHAQLDWKVAKPIKLSLGLIGTKQFDTQEKFWGYRYLFKSFQDEFKLGSSADLGVNAEITIIKSLKANVFLLNGEGYTSPQDNNGRMKFGGNLIFNPIKKLTIKAYYDIYGGKMSINDSVTVDTNSIHTVNFFAGYNHEKFRIGGGYTLQTGGEKYNKISADHNIMGISVNGTYVFNKKFEVFGTWMKYKSNKVGSSDETWNYDTDGNYIVGGLQYAPVKGVKVALNYRTFILDDPNIPNNNLLYVNFEYAF